MQVPLERGPALATLTAAVDAAADGHGSVVVLTGEAGIGKTSVVRAFTEQITARVLQGNCDDLVTPPALGALKDAAAGTDGPLVKALATESDLVFDAALAELACDAPTVLIVEDLHWADDATLDVVGYLARRVSALPAVLVLTVRDGLASSHRVHHWLGTLAAARPRHVSLGPLSVAAVAELAAGSAWDAAEVYALTGGNPFYTTEILAAPRVGDVPPTVAGALLARAARLGAECQHAVEQLAVIPGTIDFALTDQLLGDRFAALSEAEEHRILEVRADGLAFRHELARRAIEAGLPRLRRIFLHRQALKALAQQPRPELSRLVHHALAAGDGDAVVRYAPRAGRQAAAMGAHREALAHFAVAIRYQERMPPADRARLADDHAWELYNANRFAEAVEEGERAVQLYTGIGDVVRLGEARVRLSRHYYMAGDTDRAEAIAREAVAVLEPTGSTAARAYAATYHGAMLALAGDPAAATEALRRAQRLARRADRVDLVGLGLNYLSIAEPDIDDDQRIQLVTRSLRLALKHGHHEHAARGYTNLGELLYRYARLDQLERCLADGLAFTEDRGFWSHAYNLRVHQCLLRMRRGDWSAAERGLAELVDQADDVGMLEVYAEPQYGRLLARRGSDAGDLLLRAWRRSRLQRSLIGLGFAGTALAEWAWLTGHTELVEQVCTVWREHAHRPGAAPIWAEIQRYRRRAGLPADEVAGAGPWAAGLRGDWRAAAQGWRQLGDPYEEALELADSGDPATTLEALRMLDDLGASAAAALVRRRLKSLGVRTVPRGPSAFSRAHPAGLTARQVDVLDLLADGLTNAEIAEKLVLSVRTIDHHVSAILTKLGVESRRDLVRSA